MKRSPSHRISTTLVQAVALGALFACDGLLVEPAPPPPAILSVAFSLSPSAVAAARGPAEAFDRADQVVVTIVDQAGNVVHEETVPFQSTGGDTQLQTIQVALGGGESTYRLEVDMLFNGQSVFRGSETLSLEPGRATAVTISVDPVPSALEVDPVPTIDALGETWQLSGRVLLATGDTIASILVWSSQNTSVATVTPTGALTAVGEGTATVVASSEGLTGQTQVVVEAIVTTVVVSPNPANAVLGSTLQLTARALDRNENDLVRTATWSSSEPSVATIDQSGLATAVGVGTATISAEADGVTGSTTLTVTADPPTVETRPATGISTTIATLEALVNPNGLPSVAWFEWGPENDPGSFVSTPERDVGSAFTDQAFSEGLTGLEPGTSYFFRAAARNSIGTSRGEVLQLTTEALLEIRTEALPSAAVDLPYEASLEAIGGDGTYAWSVVSGSLPPGLTLSSSGQITGTPPDLGTFTFTVQVASGTQVVSRQFSIDVVSLQIVTTSLPDGVLRVPYDQTLQAIGGTGSYAWAFVGDTLPAGLTFSGSGRLSGTPQEAGTFNLTFRVTSGQQSATRTLSLFIRIPTGRITGTVTFAGSPLAGIQVSLSGTVTGVTFTNASGQYTFSTLPEGNYTATIFPGIPASTFGPVQKNTFVPDGAQVTLNFGGDGPPDLTVTSSISLSTPTPYFVGQSVTMNPWTVRNQGNGPTGTFTNRVYLSTNSIISTSDTLVRSIGNFALNPGAGVNWIGVSFTIPSNLPFGTYYVGVIVDATFVVPESNEGNNTRASSAITIFVPPSAPEGGGAPTEGDGPQAEEGGGPAEGTGEPAKGTGEPAEGDGSR